MTAAHCLNGYYELAEVRLGLTDLNNKEGKVKHQRIKISKNDAIVHEDWDGSNSDKVIREGYDIMLIRLPELAITNDVDSSYTKTSKSADFGTKENTADCENRRFRGL